TLDSVSGLAQKQPPPYPMRLVFHKLLPNASEKRHRWAALLSSPRVVRSTSPRRRLSRSRAKRDDVCSRPCPENLWLRARLFGGRPWPDLSGPSCRPSCPGEIESPDCRQLFQRSPVESAALADNRRVCKEPSQRYRRPWGPAPATRGPCAPGRKPYQHHSAARHRDKRGYLTLERSWTRSREASHRHRAPLGNHSSARIRAPAS